MFWLLADHVPAHAPGFDLSTLLQGNGILYLVMAVLAYFVLFAKKPVTPVAPVDPAPQPPVVTPPPDRPLIDAFIRLIPTLVPLLLKAEAEAAAKAQAETPK